MGNMMIHNFIFPNGQRPKCVGSLKSCNEYDNEALANIYSSLLEFVGVHVL